MKHDVTKYLTDILLSIDKIRRYIAGVQDLSQYESDDEMKDAVERRLAIIGEALFQANKQDKSLPISHKERVVVLSIYLFMLTTSLMMN